MKDHRRKRRFYRRLFRTLSDHQRQLDELRQGRKEVESSQRYPNIDFDTLTLGENTTTTSDTSANREAKYGAQAGYDYNSYNTVAERTDDFERGSLGNGSLSYRATTNSYSIQNGGFNGGNGIEGDGVLITDGENVAGEGAKIAWYFLKQDANQNRKFLFNTDQATRTFFAEVTNSRLALAMRDTGNRTDLDIDNNVSLQTGWHRVVVNHAIGGTEASLQRVYPYTGNVEHVAYCSGSHDNPMPNADDGGLDTSGGFYDRLIFA